jgi:AraC-like DNA-binding protein
MKSFYELEFIGWAHRPECNAWINKHFDYYVIDYAESGRLALQIDDQPLTIIRAPVVWLTFPGPHFKFGRKIGHWNHRFVSFRGATAERFADEGLFPCSSPVLAINAPERCSAAFDQLLDYLNNPVYGLDRAVHMLSGLLLQLHEQQKLRPQVTPDPRIHSIIRQIRKAPELNWQLKHLAAGCRMSYPHFRRLFTLAAGLPPGEFIIAERMKKAGHLLRQITPPSLKETAELCGYDDIYYFSRLFKQHYGLPPGRYRDNFQYI